MNEHRLVIYHSEVMKAMGIDKRAATRLLTRIRRKHQIPSRMYCPIDLFCEFTSIKETVLRRRLSGDSIK